MTAPIADPIPGLLDRAAREPLLPGSRSASLHGREEIEAVLPHRAPMLLLDRITALDLERGIVAASYSLDHAAEVLAGHFPGRPLWPGVLQVEAIGQAGIFLALKRSPETDGADLALTHVLGARFGRPIGSIGEVEIVAQVFENGLFFDIVGQCFHGGHICSAAAVRGVF